MSASINFNGIKDVEILQTTFTSSNSSFKTSSYRIETILPWTKDFLEKYSIGFECALNYQYKTGLAGVGIGKFEYNNVGLSYQTYGWIYSMGGNWTFAGTGN